MGQLECAKKPDTIER